MPVRFADFLKLGSRLGFGARSILGATVVAVFLSACQGQGSSYLQYGIGAQLPAADVANATELQNKYFHYLCRQAGFPQDCVLPLYDRGMWTLIVHQGMNDIDRRCDAYLQWLDNKKRSKAPVLSQVNDIQAATTSIVSLVDPTNATSLQIVAIAFNLITRSIENYHSRLLDQIESSTINSVVLRALHDFRVNTKDNIYTNRPDAEYALREYMRRCLPFAIETQINDLSTLGSRGISTQEDNTIFQAPVSNTIVGQALRDSTPKGGASDEAAPTKPDNIVEDLFLTRSVRLSADERAMPKGLPAAIQRAICVSRDDGIFGEDTRAAIKQAKQGLNFRKPRFTDTNDTLNQTMIDFFHDQSSCVNHERGYRAPFEKFAYPDAGSIRDFQTSLQSCDTALGKETDPAFTSSLQETGVFDQQTRDVIKKVREGLKLDAGETATLDFQISLSMCLN